MAKFDSHKWIREIKSGKLNETEAIATKTFMPGDMWSNDFDYVGMLKYGAQATYEGIGGSMDVEELTALYESFTDVNYHTEARDLGNALDWINDQGQDANRAQEMIEDYMESFRMACMKTLKEWKVKWKPGMPIK